MDNPVSRPAILGAGIALLLTLIVGVCTGGDARSQVPAPAVQAMEAPTPTLGPTLPGSAAPVPAAP